MISYKEALDIIEKKISSKKNAKDIPILDSVKHICAEDIFASSNIPQSDISLKDGFAVIKDEKYEVSTGENLKEGTTAVIPYEEIDVIEKLPYMYNIKSLGEDIKTGECLLKKGEYINAYSITSLASQGIKQIKVYNKVRVSILSIGDNLCPIQKDIKKGEVYNSNALSLAARVLEIGANINKVWQSKNLQTDITNCLDDLCEQNDFIITTGAMSKNDFMNILLKNENFNVLFYKVQVAPAGATSLSIYKNIPILHLPGLPLSSLLGFELLGVHILKKLKNQHIKRKICLNVKNKKEFKAKESCVNAVPGVYNGKCFTSAPSFGSGMLNILAKCNGFALIEDTSIVKTNEIIKFYSF